MSTQQTDRIAHALDGFRVELPSWGFSNTGTRFGKYVQPAAAATIEEKFADAAKIETLSRRHGIQPGSINPNLFEEQVYKFGSFGNPDPAIRGHALQHTLDSVAIAGRLDSRDIVLWFADGSNYPGTANIRQRKRWFEENLRAVHETVGDSQRLLVEYKPFEPAFYHTDVADWGMALAFARAAGPHARVLVDTGHHYQS